MAKRNDPSQKMKDEAQEYLDALPDETAEGRLVTDDGTPADAADGTPTRPASRRASIRRATSPGNTPSPPQYGTIWILVRLLAPASET